MVFFAQFMFSRPEISPSFWHTIIQPRRIRLERCQKNGSCDGMAAPGVTAQ